MNWKRWVLLVVGVVLGVGLFYWPTPWDVGFVWSDGESHLMRKNRVTGSVQHWVDGHWARDLGNP